MKYFLYLIILMFCLALASCCTKKACESIDHHLVQVSTSISQLGDSVIISRKIGNKLEEEWATIKNVTGQPIDTNLILPLPNNWKIETGTTYIFEFNLRPSKPKFELSELTFAKKKCNGTLFFGYPCDYYQELKSYRINNSLKVGFPIRI